MDIYLYNTLHRNIEKFVPINENSVGFYACGPTVYNYAHIGNLRTYVFEDILRRSLEYFGFRVRHIMNVTDVGHLTDDADQGEDKMEISAREKKMSVWEIAEFFTRAFFRDIEKLGIKPPDVACRATDHIQEMIDLIKRLETKGYTYVSGGNVYFDIEKFPRYGEMALLDRQTLKAGARINPDPNKKNPHDFVLWFTKSKFEHQAMQWDSPWGRGYPGWHIECSAMSMKYLGEQFDIHAGGIDHIPVHHTNEIAQSEAATGKRWVNYWLHGEFLVLKGAKMAKSAGNFITLTDLEDRGFEPLDFRFFCLGGHYRSQLVFTEESLTAARTARGNIAERIIFLKETLSARGISLEDGEPGDESSEYLRNFSDHLANDLNLPRCMSELWGLLKDDTIDDAVKVKDLLEMDKVLGLGLKEVASQKKEIDDESRGLIAERESAREAKNFKKADEIRDKLREKGIEIKDTPQGTKWTMR